MVAGASSQIGRCVVRRLLAENRSVVALYHSNKADISHPQLEWEQVDLTDPALQLDRQADTLIYTPGLWLLPSALPAFAKAGITRLVCFTSTSLFTKTTSDNPYERDVIAKLSRAEADVAALCAVYGMHWTILRPTLVYGMGLDKNVTTIVRFIHKFAFFPVAGKASGLRQPVHADDLALASLQAAACEAAYGQSYNLGGGEILSYYEMVGRIFDVLRMRRRIITIQALPMLLDVYSWLMKSSGINGEMAKRMNRDMVFDDSAARKDFGYYPRKFLDGGMCDLGEM